MVEVGYYFHTIKLMPYIQFARQDFDAAARPDEKRAQAGLAFWFAGHNSNLKLAWTKIDRDARQEAEPVPGRSIRSSNSEPNDPKGGIP